MRTKDLFAEEQEQYLEQYNQFVAGEKESVITGETNYRGTLPITFQIEADKQEKGIVPTQITSHLI